MRAGEIPHRADIRQLLEPGQRVGRQRLALARHGGGGEIVEVLRGAASAHGVVMVAREAHVHARIDRLERLHGVGAVAQHVAEADDLVHAHILRIHQDRP